MAIRSIIFYISTGFIVLLAFITAIYEATRLEDMPDQKQMFPYINNMKYEIDKIDIHYPNSMITLQRDAYNRWVLPLSNDFPANADIIEHLYQDIEKIQLIAHKTVFEKKFPRLGLNNPVLDKQLQGEGIRYTLYEKDNKPVVDFIVGDRLQSYKSQSNIRFFIRYASVGRAFLAEAKSDFKYYPVDFLAKDFGMPNLSEVLALQLTKDNKQILNLKRFNVNSNNTRDFSFIPIKLPPKKKLIYPAVMRDYIVALTTQLKPINAGLLPLNKPTLDASITFELTKSRLARINFWYNTTTDQYFMRIIRDDIETPHVFYIYQIAKKDYQDLIQPLERFLVTDNS